MEGKDNSIIHNLECTIHNYFLMKQLILFSFILCFLSGCDKDPIPTVAPTITTGVASNVLNTTATVGLSIAVVSNSKEVGVFCSTSLIGLSSADAQKWRAENIKSGENTVSLTGLMLGTTYYYKAYATDGTISIYGDMKTFTTGIDFPTLTTNSISSITSNKATCGGNISSSGGGTVNARGVCWSTSSNPTINLPTKTVDGSSAGSFSSTITGLLPETTYYVRAYATNEKGTVYGVQLTFTTLPISIPIIITASATSITTTTATSGGNITDDGGATVTARGICWSTTSNPTIANSRTSAGTGTGAFTSSITGLTANTTYYMRAYASYSLGTAYGNQVSFTTNAESSGIIVTDIDGNVYHTVIIGTQTWMVENLKTTRYRNGAVIPNVTDNASWAALTTGACCDYNNTPSNSVTYGKLYNWYAVNDSRNIAPAGWHVPTDAEWTTLTNYLGGESVAGGKLKETGTAHWTAPNTGATNETGFTALPGGRRGYYMGSNGNWWTSTEENSASAWIESVGYNYTDVSRYRLSKQGGLSVRCIKDN